MRAMSLLGRVSITCLFFTILMQFVCCQNAIARTRCTVESPTLSILSKRLYRAESPKVWRLIYKETSDALRLLEVKFSQSDQTSSQIRAQLLCAQELLLESAYFLSDDRQEGRLWAMKSIGHAVSLSSLTTDLLNTPSQKDRLRLLLKRVNRKSRSEKKSKASFKLGRFVTTFVSAQSKPYQLHLSTRHKSLWLKRCGLLKGCDKAIEWRVYPHRGMALSIKLPISDYQAIWSGACVNAETALSLSKKRTDSNELVTPKMSCLSSIHLIDKLTNESLSNSSSHTLFKLTDLDRELVREDNVVKAFEGSELVVDYPGYQPMTVIVPKLGKPLRISLMRCVVPLDIETSPKDVTISAPKKVYWGRSYQLLFTHKGYVSIKKTIIAPKPKNCSDSSPYFVNVKLPREIHIQAYDPLGLEVKLSSIQIGGLPLSKGQTKLQRPEGLYKVVAQTDQYPQITSTVTVPRCDTDLCGPIDLQLYFQAPPPPFISTSTQLKWLGFGVISAGLSLTLYSLSTHQYRSEQLTYAANLGSIQNRMSEMSRWSIGLLIGGLTTSVIGYAWPALTSTTTKPKDNSTIFKTKGPIP
jgi:hypothetical protein